MLLAGIDRNGAVGGDDPVPVVIKTEYLRIDRIAQPCGALGNPVKQRLKIAWRLGDHPQDLAGRGLVPERCDDTEKIPIPIFFGSVCREMRLTRRNSMTDIAADFARRRLWVPITPPEMRKVTLLLTPLLLALSGTATLPPVSGAQGWYLLEPRGDPPRSKTGEFTWSVVLHEWRMVQSFDRATNCEEMRAINIQSWDQEAKERRQQYYDRKSFPAGWGKYDPGWPDFLRSRLDDSERELARARMAQCITAIDPRLSPKSLK